MKTLKERPDLWVEERRLYDAMGDVLICGVDEAGAGPLAGPVYAAAVILPRELELPYLNDSKQLTEARRELLYPQIKEKAVAWAVATASPEEIDEINILNARMLAMDRAIEMLSPKADFALIDGNRNTGIRCPNETLVKGDGRSASIAAASILAKVSRDHHMMDMAQRYPEYRFEKHKGYPTKLHYEMLERYGPSPIHRISFLKKFYEKQK
ncbi:MAG: ribonuclease HII [Oscillospiraceae bacterium]|nr:ribonuclease HII [Oscillospiraceae bacterium]